LGGVEPEVSVILRPVADVLVGSWTTVPLFNKINSVDVNDGTLVTSDGNPSNDEFRVDLANPDVAPIVNTGHILRYRIRKNNSGGRQIDFVVRLLDRSASPSKIIATYNHTDVSNIFVQFNQTLSEAQAGNIESYNHLVVSVIGNAVGGGAGRSAQCSWANLEVPDAPADLKIVNSFVRRIESISVAELPPRFTNFSEYDTGVIPFDWTPIWRTEDQTWAVREKVGTDGGKVLEHTATLGARRMIRWNSAGLNLADVEIVGRIRNQDTGAVGTQNSLTVRGSGGGTVETGYQCRVQPIGDDWFLQLVSFKNGSAVLLTNPGLALTPLGYTANTWLWIRVRIIGNVLQGKGWLDGTTEPENFQLSFTDTTSPIVSGGVGFGAFASFGQPRDWDVFGVGYDGDEAPTTDSDVDDGNRIVTSFVRRIEGQVEAVGPTPDVLFTDFSAYTTGVQPFDWSNGWDVSGDFQWIVVEDGVAVGGKYLENTATDAGRRLLTWDAVGSALDVEMASKIRLSRPDSLDQQRLILRASGGASDFTGYWCADRGTGTFDIGRFIDGVSAVLDSVSHDILPDVWYWIRFRVIGSLVRAKIWVDGDSEPVGWMVEFDDSENVIDIPGGVGFSSFLAEFERDFDVIGVAFDGDVAPIEEPTAVERVVNSYVGRVDGEVVLEVETAVVAYVGELHGEVVSEAHKNLIVISYVDNIEGEVVLSVDIAVDGYVDGIEGEIVLEVEKVLESYVDEIHGDVLATFDRVVVTYVDRIEGEVVLQVEKVVDSFVNAIHSESVTDGFRTVESFVGRIEGEIVLEVDVEVVSYVDEIHGEANVNVVVNLDGYMDRVEGEVVVEKVKDIIVESYVDRVEGEVVTVEHRNEIVESYVDEIHGDAVLIVIINLDAYVDTIEGEVVLEKAKNIIVESYVGRIEGAVLTEEIVAGSTLFTDFSEYGTGVLPFDWSEGWVVGLGYQWIVVEDIDAVGGKYLEQTATEQGRRLLTWDAVAEVLDVEMVSKVRHSRPDSFNQQRLIIRANELEVLLNEFTQYSIGVIPSDWTRRYIETGVSYTVQTGGSNRVLRINQTTSASRGITWDELDGKSDYEITTLVHFIDTSQTIFYVIARGGTFGTDGRTGYQIQITSLGSPGGQGIRIARFDNDNLVVLEKVLKAWSPGNYHYLKVRVQGINIRAKLWVFGDVEPVVWDIEVNDSTYSSGFWGVGRFQTGEVFVDSFEAREITEVTGYWCMDRGLGNFEIGRFVDGLSTVLDSTPHSFPPDVWFWIRFRVIGDLIRAKIWEDGVVEPVGWMLEANDSVIDVEGRVGLSTFLANHERDFDVVGIGFDGVTAPMEKIEKVLRIATSFVRRIDGLVLREVSKFEELDSYVNNIEGEVERFGVGERLAESYVDAINSESVRDEVLGERIVDGYVRRIVSVSERGRRFFTDFKEYAISVQPNDWTTRWDVGGGSEWRIIEHGGEFALQHLADEDGHRLITWDVVPLVADIEIAVVVHVVSVVSDQARVILRASGGDGSERGWVVTLSNGMSVLLINMDDGEFNLIAQDSFIYDEDVYVFMRFRIFRDEVKVRVWNMGDPEPMDWLIEVVDDRNMDSGWGGVGGYNFETDGLHFLFFGVATLGLTAPLEFPQDVERTVVSYVDDVFSEADREGSGERDLDGYVDVVNGEVVREGFGDKEVESYVDVVNGENVIEADVKPVSFVALIDGEIERFGEGERLVEAHLNIVFSEVKIEVVREVMAFINAIFSEVEREGSGERNLDGFVDEIVGEIFREGSGEREVEVYVDRIEGESIATLAVVRDVEGFVNTVFAEVERVGSGERSADGYVDVINGEVERLGSGERLVEGFVDELHGEVERVGSGERDVDGFVNRIDGEVERVGSGERVVDSYSDEIFGEARVEVELRVVSFVGVINGEAVRDGSVGEREVDGFVNRIDGESVAEADGLIMVVSFVERIEGESVREVSVEKTVDSFSNEIHGESIINVKVEVDGYVREIESEVVREGSGERVVSAYVDVIIGDNDTTKIEARNVESYVREIFAEVIREGFGLKDVESFVDAVFSEAVSERSAVRVVNSFINIGSESVREAVNFETVVSWVRTIFGQVFLFDPPPLFDEDIDLGLLVSVEEIDLGLLVEGDVEDGEVDLGELVMGEVIDLGLLK
jgi:hypothetical protein